MKRALAASQRNAIYTRRRVFPHTFVAGGACNRFGYAFSNDEMITMKRENLTKAVKNCIYNKKWKRKQGSAAASQISFAQFPLYQLFCSARFLKVKTSIFY